MIANFLPYVPHFVHRGRKFASSTALYPTLCIFIKNDFIFKWLLKCDLQWQRQCAPHGQREAMCDEEVYS